MKPMSGRILPHKKEKPVISRRLFCLSNCFAILFLWSGFFQFAIQRTSLYSPPGIDLIKGLRRERVYLDVPFARFVVECIFFRVRRQFLVIQRIRRGSACDIDISFVEFDLYESIYGLLRLGTRTHPATLATA